MAACPSGPVTAHDSYPLVTESACDLMEACSPTVGPLTEWELSPQALIADLLASVREHYILLLFGVLYERLRYFPHHPRYKAGLRALVDWATGTAGAEKVRGRVAATPCTHSHTDTPIN